MLLWELLAPVGTEHAPFDAPKFVGVELGEEFAVLTDERAPVHRVKTLELALGVLESELKAHPTADAKLVVRGKVLCVSMAFELGRPWGRNVPRLMDELRMAVAHYSMEGSWPQTINGEQVSVGFRRPRSYEANRERF